jgi:hypothetical protein
MHNSDVVRELKTIHNILATIQKDIQTIKNSASPATTVIADRELLELPDHLRKVYLYVAGLGRETDADEVALGVDYARQ